MPAIINSSTTGDLNPGTHQAGSPVATAIAIVRRTFLSTTLGDAFSAQTSYSWDQVSGEGRLVLPTQSGAIDDSVSITLGAGLNLQRLAGTLISFDTTLAPHSVTALCKTQLYALEEFENATETISSADGSGRPGLAFSDLVGTSSGATLKQIVVAVLGVVGITAYSLDNLADPAHVYGLIADEEFTWGTYETAAAYLHRVLEASAGYRLFDSTDGNTYLAQTSAIPDVDPKFTFELGKDIFPESQSSSSKIGQRAAVLVQGYDDSFGPATNNPSGNPIASAFRINNTLIEDDAFATEIGDFWLPQVSRRQEIVRLQTPRDDLFGPGQTHYIDAAGGLSVNDTMWLKSVTSEITSSGEFTQHLVYVAGAAA